MQFLSLGTQYTITALILLSKQETGTAVSASKLAKPLNTPSTYLSQMLARLVSSGIVGTRRGISGGVYLNREPEDISLFEIITAVEGDSFFQSCFLGISGCGDIEPCPFHEEWRAKKADIKSWLEDTSLADIARDSSPLWKSDFVHFARKTEAGTRT